MRPEDMPNPFSNKRERIFSKRTVLGVVLVAVAIILIIAGGAIIFTACRSSAELLAAEYDAQMAANGFYKEDVHILNQFAERRSVDTMFWFGLLAALLSIVPGAGGLALLLDF